MFKELTDKEVMLLSASELKRYLKELDRHKSMMNSHESVESIAQRDEVLSKDSISLG